MTSPPPALDCAQVIEYAITDESVTFTQRNNLFVGGEVMGQVPKLAICRNLDETSFMLFHCSADWDVLGCVSGCATVEEAKIRAERSYAGIANKWIPSSHTKEEAQAYVEENFKDDRCSFCGRLPLQIQYMFGNERSEASICNYCVSEFGEMLIEAGKQ